MTPLASDVPVDFTVMRMESIVLVRDNRCPFPFSVTEGLRMKKWTVVFAAVAAGGAPCW